MKKTLGGIMLLLLATSIQAAGMGVINNMDFGNVGKGTTHTKYFQFYPIDKNCKPYTDIECTTNVLVKIESDDPWLRHIDEIIAPVNQYTETEVKLSIPRNARKGSYEYDICAIGMKAIQPDGTGIGINVGACADVTYNVVSKQPRFMFLSKWFRRI